jgi:FkbM family methyltransferase
VTVQSLINAVRSRVAAFRRRRRELQWQQLSATAPYIRHEVRPGLFLDLPSQSDLSRFVFVYDLEGTERRLLSSLLRPGDEFVDIGANFGLYTLDAAVIVGPSGRVLAFEPSLTAYGHLRHNLDLILQGDGEVEVRQIALSDRDGEAVLKVSQDGRDAWNTLGASLHEVEYHLQPVAIARLDTVLAAEATGWRPAMIKIDVEGWEGHVVRGAQRLLGRDDAPILQIEFAPRYFEENGLSITALGDDLTAHGYDLFQPTGPRSMRRHRFGVDELSGNLYAAKPSGPWFSRVQALLENAGAAIAPPSR